MLTKFVSFSSFDILAGSTNRIICNRMAAFVLLFSNKNDFINEVKSEIYGKLSRNLGNYFGYLIHKPRYEKLG